MWLKYLIRGLRRRSMLLRVLFKWSYVRGILPSFYSHGIIRLKFH
jgi:hypothetical protein